LTGSAKKLFSFLIKAGILVLAFVFIYHQYLQKGDSIQKFRELVGNISRQKVILTLSLVVALMVVNWVLESFKWRYLTRSLEKISVWAAIEAVFCGLTWAIFTPNRLGEYAGRVLFLPNRKRVYGVFAMAVGSFGQNVITNVVGLSALMWYLFTYYHLNTWIYVIVCVSCINTIAFFLVMFFHIKWVVNLLDKIPYIKKFHRFFEIMGGYQKSELIKIMGFSLARYAVFSFQYYLIIHLLIPDIPAFPMMMLVFVFFFIQSAIPSLDLLDIGVRSGAAAILFVHVTDQALAIAAAVSSIWLINLIIPAILGSVFVFKLKFFDRNL
jgi:hypothetical protein